MDPLTHCLVGGMAAKTAGTSKRRFWIMCFLGSAPDLDVIFSALGSWAWIVQHRGISHSILGVALQALFYSWLFSRWDQGPFKQRALHYAFPLALHVVCDFLTAFGVPLLSPFHFREFSADLMVGLTLIPMFIMTVGLVWSYVKNDGGWKATRPVWFGWVLYLMMAVSGKAYAGKLVPTDGATTLPSTGNPFAWSVVCPDHGSNSYKRFEVDLVRGRHVSKAAVPMPAADFPIEASKTHRDVQKFLEAHRWPVARAVAKGDGWDVEWGQLMFSTRGMVRGKIRASVDAKGRVLDAERIFTFWDPESPDTLVPAAVPSAS